MNSMEEFFNYIRAEIFGGKMSQGQVDGVNRLLDAWVAYGDGNINHLAKVMATSTWETGKRMQPVKETTKPQDINVPSDATVIKRLDAAFAKGQLKWVKKPYWKDGWFGRGDVQLTHEVNYSGKIREAVDQVFHVDIWLNRDLVLRPDISAFILIRGMLEGWFTGKKLSSYIDDLDESDLEDRREYVAARATVNGKDRAEQIADLALKWEKAFKLLFATTTPAEPPISIQPPIIPPAEPKPIPVETLPQAPKKVSYGPLILAVLLAAAGIGFVLLANGVVKLPF